MVIFKVCVFFLNIICTIQLQKSDLVVHTTLGKIKGRVVKVPGTDNLVAEFLGIPYAEPPINNLRFSDPVPKKKWKDVFDADKFGDSCMQIRLNSSLGKGQDDLFNPPGNMSEDCLFLNIWTPYPLVKKAASMIWIHGGSFYCGNAAIDMFNGRTLSGNNDVIVVTINYRLGAFGFLASGDGKVKGNFGLKDQLESVKWVNKNIAAFGGDPNSISLFGASAGAASVGFLLVSPLNENYIQKAIIQSGSPNSYWALLTPEMAQDRFSKFVQSVNCHKQYNLLQCLRNLSPNKILENQFVVKLGINWIPIIDDDIISHEFNTTKRTTLLKNRNMLIGVNRNEAKLFFGLGMQYPEQINSLTRKEYSNLIENLTVGYPAEILEVIKFLYTDWVNLNSSQNNFDNLDKLFSDRDFICPSLEWSQIMSDAGNDVYVYRLSYQASAEVLPKWLGVTHTMEMQWIFGLPLNESLGYTKKEMELSRNLMRYWTNFAKYGNPNSETKSTDCLYWPKFQYYERNYLEISPSMNLKIDVSLRDQGCAFWNDLLPKLQSISSNKTC